MPHDETMPEHLLHDNQLSIAEEFLSHLKTEIPYFVQAVEHELTAKYNLDVTYYQADHVCYRTETLDEYKNLIQSLSSSSCHAECKLLIESTIGGRPIATFALRQGIPVGNRCIKVIEIPAPKQGSMYPKGLEHVEFVLTTNQNENMTVNSSHSPMSPVNDEHHQKIFDSFMKQNPQIPWNSKAKTKDINPDISLKLQLKQFGLCSVKFHLMPLAEVIEYEKEHGIITKA